MKRFSLILLLLSMAFPASAADSADMVLSEIKVMGHLNGQALACSHRDAITRIKAYMIKLTPKSRIYGEAFEAATNEGYLAQTKNEQAICPDEPALVEQVEEEAKRFQAALPAVPHK